MANDDAQKLRDLKWKEIMSRVDAYRFYIKICLEANAFFFATTGVILGFYLKEPIVPANPFLKFFLLLPILMGSVLGSICFHATELQKEGRRIIQEIRKDLKTEDIPDIRLLDLFLLIFGFIFFLVAVSLILVPLLKEGRHSEFFRYFLLLTLLVFAVGVVSTFVAIRHVKAR